MATLLEHWQPSTTSTLGMKNNVGLAKESCSVYADSFATDTEERFLVVAGNTDKTIRCSSYNCKGWKPDAVDVYSGVCGTCGYTEEVSAWLWLAILIRRYVGLAIITRGGNLMLYMFILESVELMDTYKLISGMPYRTVTLKQLLSIEIVYNSIL